jgi:hypothetical protein
MPSDDRVTLACAAVRGPREAFRAALAATAHHIRAFLAAQRGASESERARRLAAELGVFAAGRVDAGKLAALFQSAETRDPAALAAVERAGAVIEVLGARDLPSDVVDVPPGGDLRASVAQALAEVGRAFAAVRTFEVARSGGRRAGEAAAALDAFPYPRWSRGERRAAPPLVVVVDGADLGAAGLAEFLDGMQKIVLVVRGACAPAPLVRLVTPGTFVLQTGDGAGLDRFAAWEGPGIAALVPDSAARFAHDPRGGALTWERITVDFVPEREPRVAIGGSSTAQQAEELRQLRQMAARPEAPVAPVPPPSAAMAGVTAAPADPAGKLAAWLLAQANLDGMG